MKKGITLAACLLLSAWLVWGNTPAELSYLYCRQTITDDTLPLSDQIEKDLVSGVWVEETTAASGDYMEFDASGHAMLMEANGDFTYRVSRYSWGIEAGNEHPLLVFFDDQEQETLLFRIDPTCAGIQLTDLNTGEKASYAYQSADASQANAVKAALTGEWRNTRANLTLSSPDCGTDGAVEIDKASILLEFHADGTFIKVIRCLTKDIRFEERGQWEVAADGKKVLLHVPVSGGQMITQALRIKHIELDELVVETPLAVVGRTFTSVPNNDFYFNKI